MDNIYINSFDKFAQENNRILVTEDPEQNANHILILMNSGRNFGLLCASTPNETVTGNGERMKQLVKEVLKLKCSYIPFKYGLSYASAGDSVERNEDNCLFIPGIKLEQLLELAEKYEQATAVYGNKNELKSYNVQTGKPDVIQGAVDIKLAVATVFFYPGTFR